MKNLTDRQTKLDILREKIAKVEISHATGETVVVSTGLPELDAILPDRGLRKTKHATIFEYVHSAILSGPFSVGQRIPSETQLSRRFETTRVTVGKALRELEHTCRKKVISSAVRWWPLWAVCCSVLTRLSFRARPTP